VRRLISNSEFGILNAELKLESRYLVSYDYFRSSGRQFAHYSGGGSLSRRMLAATRFMGGPEYAAPDGALFPAHRMGEDAKGR
jgi:hypothetical protein